MAPVQRWRRNRCASSTAGSATYRKFWEGSFDRMDAYLKQITQDRETQPSAPQAS